MISITVRYIFRGYQFRYYHNWLPMLIPVWVAEEIPEHVVMDYRAFSHVGIGKTRRDAYLDLMQNREGI